MTSMSLNCSLLFFSLLINPRAVLHGDGSRQRQGHVKQVCTSLCFSRRYWSCSRCQSGSCCARSTSPVRNVSFSHTRQPADTPSSPATSLHKGHTQAPCRRKAVTLTKDWCVGRAGCWPEETLSVIDKVNIDQGADKKDALLQGRSYRCAPVCHLFRSWLALPCFFSVHRYIHAVFVRLLLTTPLIGCARSHH